MVPHIGPMQTAVTIYGQNDEVIGKVQFLGFTPSEDEIWDTAEFTQKQREFLLPICRERSDYYWKERQTVTLSENEEKEFQKIS